MTTAGATLCCISTSANASTLSDVERQARRRSHWPTESSRLSGRRFVRTTSSLAEVGDVPEQRYRRTSVAEATRSDVDLDGSHGKLSGQPSGGKGLGRVATAARGVEAVGRSRAVSMGRPAHHWAGWPSTLVLTSVIAFRHGHPVVGAAYSQGGRQSLTREVWC